MTMYIISCNKSDCTSMSPGGRCSDLDFLHKRSLMVLTCIINQKVEDLMKMHATSRQNCSFPVEILSSELAFTNGQEHNIHKLKYGLEFRFFLTLLLTLLMY